LSTKMQVYHTVYSEISKKYLIFVDLWCKITSYVCLLNRVLI
jgi:hypothetical protein